MDPTITATTQLRDDYTCEVPLTFAGDVVGHIRIDPERLRQAALKSRLRGELGPPRELTAGETEELVSKLTGLNWDAFYSTIYVCNSLKQHSRGDTFLEDLAAEFFLWGGDLSDTRRQKYLRKMGLRVLGSKPVQAFIEQRIEEKDTPAVRDLIQNLVRGQPGRPPSVSHEARDAMLLKTMAELDEHIPALEKATDRHRYFHEHVAHTPIGQRITQTSWADAWFPDDRTKVRLGAERMAAALMHSESWGGEASLRKDARRLRKRK